MLCGMNHKSCLACGMSKTLFEFASSPNSDSPDKLAYICRDCNASLSDKEKARIYARQWRKNNIEKARRINYAANIRTLYGVGIDDYEAQAQAQNYCCALCGIPAGKRRLNVDHCHKTGKVGKLLCQPCNTGLGNFKDDLALLRKAIEYLQQNR